MVKFEYSPFFLVEKLVLCSGCVALQSSDKPSVLFPLVWMLSDKFRSFILDRLSDGYRSAAQIRVSLSKVTRKQNKRLQQFQWKQIERRQNLNCYKFWCGRVLSLRICTETCPGLIRNMFVSS